jgi:hypothetical protein
MRRGKVREGEKVEKEREREAGQNFMKSTKRKERKVERIENRERNRTNQEERL